MLVMVILIILNSGDMAQFIYISLPHTLRPLLSRKHSLVKLIKMRCREAEKQHLLNILTAIILETKITWECHSEVLLQCLGLVRVLRLLCSPNLHLFDYYEIILMLLAYLSVCVCVCACVCVCVCVCVCACVCELWWVKNSKEQHLFDIEIFCTL